MSEIQTPDLEMLEELPEVAAFDSKKEDEPDEDKKTEEKEQVEDEEAADFEAAEEELMAIAGCSRLEIVSAAETYEVTVEPDGRAYIGTSLIPNFVPEPSHVGVDDKGIEHGMYARVMTGQRTEGDKKIYTFMVQNYRIPETEQPAEEVSKEELLLTEPLIMEQPGEQVWSEEENLAPAEQVENKAAGYATDAVELPGEITEEVVIEASPLVAETDLETSIIVPLPKTSAIEAPLPTGVEQPIAIPPVETILQESDKKPDIPQGIEVIADVREQEATPPKSIEVPIVENTLEQSEIISQPQVEITTLETPAKPPVQNYEVNTVVPVEVKSKKFKVTEIVVPQEVTKIEKNTVTVEQAPPQPKSIMAEVTARETTPISITPSENLSTTKETQAPENDFVPKELSPTPAITAPGHNEVQVPIETRKLQPVVVESASTELPITVPISATEKPTILVDDLAVTYEPSPSRLVVPEVTINDDSVATLEVSPKPAQAIERSPKTIKQTPSNISQPISVSKVETHAQPPVVEKTTPVSSEVPVTTIEVISVDQPEQDRIVEDDFVITQEPAPVFNSEKVPFVNEVPSQKVAISETVVESASTELPITVPISATEKPTILVDDLAVTYEPSPSRLVVPEVTINDDSVATLEVSPKPAQAIERSPKTIKQTPSNISQPISVSKVETHAQPPVVEKTTPVSSEVPVTTIEVISVDQPEQDRIKVAISETSESPTKNMEPIHVIPVNEPKVPPLVAPEAITQEKTSNPDITPPEIVVDLVQPILKVESPAPIAPTEMVETQPSPTTVSPVVFTPPETKSPPAITEQAPTTAPELTTFNPQTDIKEPAPAAPPVPLQAPTTPAPLVTPPPPQNFTPQPPMPPVSTKFVIPEAISQLTPPEIISAVSQPSSSPESFVPIPPERPQPEVRPLSPEVAEEITEIMQTPPIVQQENTPPLFPPEIIIRDRKGIITQPFYEVMAALEAAPRGTTIEVVGPVDEDGKVQDVTVLEHIQDSQTGEPIIQQRFFERPVAEQSEATPPATNWEVATVATGVFAVQSEKQTFSPIVITERDLITVAETASSRTTKAPRGAKQEAAPFATKPQPALVLTVSDQTTTATAATTVPPISIRTYAAN